MKQSKDQDKWTTVGFFGDLTIESYGKNRRLVDKKGVIHLKYTINVEKED